MISIKSEFIPLWDGFTTAQNAQVLVFTATNRLSKLGESNTWCLPQAFGIYVSDQWERAEKLNAILKGERIEENIDFECIAFLCKDYTSSDLFVLCKKVTFFFHLEKCWVKKRKG